MIGSGTLFLLIIHMVLSVIYIIVLFRMHPNAIRWTHIFFTYSVLATIYPMLLSVFMGETVSMLSIRTLVTLTITVIIWIALTMNLRKSLRSVPVTA